MDGPTLQHDGDRLFDSIRFPAVDGDGNIYTGDSWVFREPDPRMGPTCSVPGRQVQPVVRPAVVGDWVRPPPDGGYNINNGVAVSPAGSLSVVDTFEQRVQKFDTASFCRSQLNCPGWLLQFGSREPAGPNRGLSAYPRTLTFGSGKVWIGEKTTPSWRGTRRDVVHRFGSQGPAPGQFKGGVQGILVPGNGKIYATDLGGCRLQDLRRVDGAGAVVPRSAVLHGHVRRRCQSDERATRRRGLRERSHGLRRRDRDEPDPRSGTCRRRPRRR